MSVSDALEVLRGAGVVVSLPENLKHYSLKTAAERLDCSPRYLRDHLDEFPNVWRMSGGENIGQPKRMKVVVINGKKQMVDD